MAWTEEVTGILQYYIRSMAVYNGDLYVGNDGGEVWKRTSGGVWTKEVTGIDETHIWSMAVYNGELYVGTGNEGEVWKRTSGGVWTQEVTGISEYYIYSMTVYNDELYVGTGPEGEVWKRTSSGIWTEEVTGIDETYIESMAVFEYELYVGTRGEAEVWKLEGINYEITLNFSQCTLLPYNTLQLIATTIPSDAEVTWTSSNYRVATVDEFGLVEVYSRGTATITATITGASATCEITIGGKMGNSTGIYSVYMKRTSDSSEVKTLSMPVDPASVFSMAQTVQSFFNVASGGSPREGRVMIGLGTITLDFDYTEAMAQFLIKGYADSATKTSYGAGHGCLAETFEVLLHPNCLPSGDKESDIKMLQGQVDVTIEKTASIDGKQVLKCVFTAQAKDMALPTAEVLTLTAGSGGALALYWVGYAENGTGYSIGTAILTSTVDDDKINFTLPKGATGMTLFAATDTPLATAIKYYQVTAADIALGYVISSVYTTGTSGALPTSFTGVYDATIETGA